jgi:hypothetical protein
MSAKKRLTERQLKAFDRSVLRLAKTLDLPVPLAGRLAQMDINRYANYKKWFTKKELSLLAEQAKERPAFNVRLDKRIAKAGERRKAENRARLAVERYGLSPELAQKLFVNRFKAAEKERERIRKFLNKLNPKGRGTTNNVKAYWIALESLIHRAEHGRRFSDKQIIESYQSGGRK